MWRSVIKSRATIIIRPGCLRLRSNVRAFASTHTHGSTTDLPPVNFLGPTTWAVCAIASIFGVAAALDVRSEIKRSTIVAQGSFGKGSNASGHSESSPSQLLKAWQNVPSQDQPLVAIAGFNVAAYGLSAALPAFAQQFYHIPAAALHRNYTMFTSMFGHAGVLHLGINTYVLINFGRPVTRAKTFQGSASHFTAFYLAAGVFSSWFSHVTSIWPSQRVRLSAGLGSSGAICALAGTFAMSFPDARIGIILLPFSFPASEALLGFAAIETYGLFRGIPFYPVGHGAHLGGLIAGVAYVYFDGKTRIWDPTRRFMFRSMRQLGLV